MIFSPKRIIFKIALFCFFIVLPLWGNGQSIHGWVYQAGNDSTIAHASVYYTGSLTGTLTNRAGEFSLRVQAGKTPVIVSCVGYYSETINDYNPEQALKVYLKPKIQALREVSIGFDSKSREQKVAMFKKEFLGTSTYAKSCVINNMDDVELTYHKKTHTLTAYCSNPIEIDNKKLGYHISYFLDKFEMTDKSVLFTGNFTFKETIDPVNREKIMRNREDAYEGSRMQFIRAIWANRLEKTRFGIYLYGTSIPTDSIVVRNKLSQEFIYLTRKVVIMHDDDRTVIWQIKPGSYINQNGFCNASLIWSGIMGDQRVGDMLPFEYQSEKEIRYQLPTNN
jgi:hypothetical protein